MKKHYRLGKNKLIETLKIWDSLIPGMGLIHLIACGGTALTLMGYKESTKDVDFIVPVPKEYERMTRFLKDAGYRPQGQSGWMRMEEGIVYDLFKGKKIFTTELLDSPMKKDRNQKIFQGKRSI
jgi:hypothetical protein